MKQEIIKKNEKENQEVKEPAASYIKDTSSSKKIFIYQSFEEQQQAEDIYAASLTPIERLRQAVEIIRQVYKDELKNYVPTKRITFIKTK